MPKLIVLTCASGKQCSHLLPLLHQYPSYRLRLLGHSQQSLQRLAKAYPAAEVLQTDLGNPNACLHAVKGANIIYYIPPTFQPHEAQFGFNMIDAASAEASKPGSNFSHFIFSSVLHPEISKMLNHDRKRLVEEYLYESCLPYTILQPSHFADNAMGQLLSLRDSSKPVFVAAFDPEVTFSFSCLKDHAEASAKVIREGVAHYYATYQLVSTWPMKYTEYVRSVGEEMGIDIEIQRAPYGEVVEKFCQRVFGQDQVKGSRRDGPERMLLYYNRRGLVGNPGVLEWLLGRPGTTPAELVRQMLRPAETK